MGRRTVSVKWARVCTDAGPFDIYMDTGKKRVGTVVLCGVFILPLGTGAAFAANNPEYMNGLGVADTSTSNTYFIGINGDLYPPPITLTSFISMTSIKRISKMRKSIFKKF